jgi:hypothetical protein
LLGRPLLPAAAFASVIEPEHDITDLTLCFLSPEDVVPKVGCYAYALVNRTRRQHALRFLKSFSLVPNREEGTKHMYEQALQTT